MEIPTKSAILVGRHFSVRLFGNSNGLCGSRSLGNRMVDIGSFVQSCTNGPAKIDLCEMF